MILHHSVCARRASGKVLVSLLYCWIYFVAFGRRDHPPLDFGQKLAKDVVVEIPLRGYPCEYWCPFRFCKAPGERGGKSSKAGSSGCSVLASSRPKRRRKQKLNQWITLSSPCYPFRQWQIEPAQTQRIRAKPDIPSKSVPRRGYRLVRMPRFTSRPANRKNPEPPAAIDSVCLEIRMIHCENSG